MDHDAIVKKIAALEATVSVHQGNIELAMYFIVSKHENEAYMDFLRLVVSSGKFSKEATFVAKKFLDLEDMWGKHVFAGLTQQ